MGRNWNASIIVTGVLIAVGTPAFAQQNGGPLGDPITVLAGRLDLEKYKATIKGLTQFGDRRQGTDRNRGCWRNCWFMPRARRTVDEF